MPKLKLLTKKVTKKVMKDLATWLKLHSGRTVSVYVESNEDRTRHRVAIYLDRQLVDALECETEEIAEQAADHLMLLLKEAGVKKTFHEFPTRMQ